MGVGAADPPRRAGEARDPVWGRELNTHGHEDPPKTEAKEHREGKPVKSTRYLWGFRQKDA